MCAPGLATSGDPLIDDFAGRVAVITGAASGIGRGLAAKAAGEGMKVVLADVETGALAEADGEVRALGAETLAVLTDVSNAAAVDSLAAAAYDQFGAVHLLCLNAGVFQAGLAWQRTEADWAWVLGVNLWGPIHGVRAFVPRLLAQGDPAHVVITSSMAGLMTVGHSGPYVVSKFAAAALAECLAHDLQAQGADIGVSCLVPGSVDTRIAESTRNRPDEPPSEAQAPDHHFVAAALREMTSTQGRPPAAVADIVFDAVRAGQFWIPTTDHYEELIRPRYEALLARRLPTSAQFD
jgi:NAD(P)-dependent dehydrogenase (short-subunit alcohol dehydrogenase family)